MVERQRVLFWFAQLTIYGGEVEETTQESVFMAIILVNERYVLALTLLPFFQLLSYATGQSPGRVFFLRIAWVGLRDLRWRRVVFGMSDSENSLLMALGQFVIILDSWGMGKVLDSFPLLPFSYFYFYIFCYLNFVQGTQDLLLLQGTFLDISPKYSFFTNQSFIHIFVAYGLFGDQTNRDNNP